MAEKNSKAFIFSPLNRFDSTSGSCNSSGRVVHDGAKKGSYDVPFREISDRTNKQTTKQTSKHTHTEYQYYYIRYLPNLVCIANFVGKSATFLAAVIYKDTHSPSLLGLIAVLPNFKVLCLKHIRLIKVLSYITLILAQMFTPCIKVLKLLNANFWDTCLIDCPI